MIKAALFMVAFMASAGWGSEGDSALPVQISSGIQGAYVNSSGRLLVDIDTPTVKIGDGVYTASVTSSNRLKVDAAISMSQSVPTNFYSADTDSLLAVTAGVENPIFLLSLPQSSTKTVKVYTRVYNIEETNVRAQFHLFKNCVVTSSGTALTIAKIGSTTNAPLALAYKLPTISNNGTLVDTHSPGQNTAPTQIDDNFILWLNAGEKYLITIDPFSNSRQFDVNVKWMEE